MPIELNHRFTFDHYVVGQSNRLAAAAGRRVAEMPGQAYNPLFVYSGSGLGKTHLLNAIGHHARKLHPNFAVVYYTLEHFLDVALELIESGEREELRARVERIGFLLLDDVQFLAGRLAAQDELLRAWDAVSARGGQVVLASDRPPSEINGLDQRLLSRFSGGLIADIGIPDYETRVAILNRKVTEAGQVLAPGVAQALAKLSFSNVRELQGGLNKVTAIQDLDKREVTASEIPALFEHARSHHDDEFSGFLTDISGTVNEVISHSVPEAKLADAILHWQSEGYSTRRLELALATPPKESEVDEFLKQYEVEIRRLQQLEEEIRVIEPEASELVRGDLFRTPDRLRDAEQLLANVRERNRPVPAPPAGFSFDTLNLPADSFALRAARAVSEQPSERYNPFLAHDTNREDKSALLAALANELARRLPERPTAFVKGQHFAAELIQAIEQNCVESWRSRYHNTAVFVLDDIEGLIGTERAQDELFHIFEVLKRNGAQLVFGSSAAPGKLTGLDERLRTRLDSGLVVGLQERNNEPRVASQREEPPRIELVIEQLSTDGESATDEWFLSHEKVVWKWPYLEDWLSEEME